LEGWIVSSRDVLYYVDYSILGKRGFLVHASNIMNMLRITHFAVENTTPKYLLAETFNFLHVCLETRYRDFFYTSLNVETEAETINFEPESETQMEVVETIKYKTREICSRLKFLKLSRPRLSETMEISGCQD
jgi:hypothetical protein